MLAAKSLHISRVLSYFHDTAFEIQAGFGAVAVICIVYVL
jgi:hypothetical protein